MRKLRHVFIVWGLLIATAGGYHVPLAHSDVIEGTVDFDAIEDFPQRALPLNNGNITPTAARLRLTRSAWDYLRITVRDTFQKWGTPGLHPDGANLILDPGYDHVNHGTAGVMRTTPMLWDWVRYDEHSRVKQNPGCESATNCFGGTEWVRMDCGFKCLKTSQRAPDLRWLQVRRPGAVHMGGYPAVPSDVRSNFREHGFYIAEGSQSFDQLQFCTTRYSMDAGSGNTSACKPQMKDVALSIDLDYNIRLFIFPNMHVEHERAGGDNWTPPKKRGPYIGMGNLQRHLITSASDCEAGVNCVKNGTVSCFLYKLDKYRPSSCKARTSQRWDVWMNNLPTTTAAYDIGGVYDRQLGTYFRPGDDQALYLNYNQMQVHSMDRPSFNGTYACGPERVYTGTLSGSQPRYIIKGQAANCVLPKMYWSTEKNEWTQCNAFDTWNSDGSYNPNNDDNKWLYPGHPVTGGYGSPGRCGAQPPCTNPTCTNMPNPKALSSAQMENRFNPGGGWYMLKLDEFKLRGGTDPRIELTLGARDLRLELGLAADLYLSDIPLFPDSNNRNKRVLGYVSFESLVVKATLRLFSVDDTSCSSNPAACSGFFEGYNDNELNPARLTFEATVDSLKLTRSSPFLMPSAYYDNISLDLGILGSISFTFRDVLNDEVKILGIRVPLGVPDMLLPIIEDALIDKIAPFLEEFAADIPNLNTALGNPMNLGTALIETGVYAVGGNYNNARKTMPDGTVRWPIFMQPGPSSGSEVADLRLSLGFKPVAFRPPVGVNQVMEIDNFDPPRADSVYGVPTLMNPNTSGCGANCSRGSHPATVDEDQEYDGDDYVVGASGSYLDPITGLRKTLSRYTRIPEHWVGPIASDKRPPSWCLRADAVTGGPRTLRMNGGSENDFKALYPQTRWLTFNPSYDQAPPDSGMLTPGVKNTVGTWDTVPGNLVFRQNANNWNLRESGSIPYDFSLHVHQRSLAQFLQAVFASGAACLEFAPEDEEGADTPWKDMLSTERFASFIPGLSALFPDGHMKVRLTPTATPRVRTGMGSLDFTPSSEGIPVGEAPLRMTGSYLLSVAIPDLKVDFVLEDGGGGEVSVLTMYWTPVLGLHMQSVRRCFYLDPLFNDPQCTSPYVNVRTVSGYYEVYIDLNSPSLMRAWENHLDFPNGYFNDIGSTRGSSSVVIARTFCDGSARCDRLGLANAVPALMNSFVNMFFVTRMNFANFTIDAVHLGPDGPNDDGVGGGDYLGVYARFLGNLNVFSLLEMAGNLSPPGSLEPQAFVPAEARQEWHNSRTPVVPLEALGSFAHLGQSSDVGYTWSIDDGFWHTPSNAKELKLPTLTEGRHTLKVRAVEYTEAGPKVALEAQEYTFRVDTIPPEISLSGGADGKPIIVQATDTQTPQGYVEVEYAWNGGEWRRLQGNRVPLDGLVRGEHLLQVRARDLAGNESGARLRFSGGEAPWWERAFGMSCSQASGNDGGALLLLASLGILVLRRRSLLR